MQLLALLALGFVQRQHQRLDLARHVVERLGHGPGFEGAGDLHAGAQVALAERIGGLRQPPQHACIGAQQQGEQEQDGEDVERRDAGLDDHRAPDPVHQRLGLQGDGQAARGAVGQALGGLLQGLGDVQPAGKPGRGCRGGGGGGMHFGGGQRGLLGRLRGLPPERLHAGAQVGDAIAQDARNCVGIRDGCGRQARQEVVTGAAQLGRSMAVDFAGFGLQQGVVAHATDQQDDQHDGDVEPGGGAPQKPCAEICSARHRRWPSPPSQVMNR